MLFSLLLAGLVARAVAQTVPDQAQVIDRHALVAQETVQPPSVENLTSVGAIVGL